jgi:ribonuclease J
MRVRIHRGTHEIGGSCIELEADGQRILLDAGLPLGLPHGAAPNLPNIDTTSLIAIVISHPHLDHFGLLPWLPSVPVVMGSAARRILNVSAPFMCQPTKSMAGPDLIDRQTLLLIRPGEV